MRSVRQPVACVIAGDGRSISAGRSRPKKMFDDYERYQKLLLQLGFDGFDDIHVERFGAGWKTFDDFAVF